MGLLSIGDVVRGAGRFEEQVEKLERVREWRVRAEERREELVLELVLWSRGF